MTVLTKAVLSHVEPLAVLSGHSSTSASSVCGPCRWHRNQEFSSAIGALDCPGCFNPWPLLGERPTRSLTALGLLAFVGVIILTWRPEIGSATRHRFAVLLIVSGAAFAALYSIAIRWMSVDVDALRLTRANQTVGWLAVGIVWFATRTPHIPNLDIIDGAMIAGSGLLLNAILS